MPIEVQSQPSLFSTPGTTLNSRLATRPAGFSIAYVAFRNLPYSFGLVPVGEGACSGGVLRRGQVVWAKGSLKGGAERMVAVYLDGTGSILLDPAYLVPADVLCEIRIPCAREILIEHTESLADIC